MSDVIALPPEDRIEMDRWDESRSLRRSPGVIQGERGRQVVQGRELCKAIVHASMWSLTRGAGEHAAGVLSMQGRSSVGRAMGRRCERSWGWDGDQYVI